MKGHECVFWAVSFQNLEMHQHPAGPSLLACSHVLFTMHTLSLSLSLSWPSPSVSHYRGGQWLSPPKASPPCSVIAEKSKHSAAQTRSQKIDLNFYFPSPSLPPSPLTTPDSHTYPVNHQILNQLPSKSLKSICISHPSCHCPSPLTRPLTRIAVTVSLVSLIHSYFHLIYSVPLSRAVFTPIWSCHFPDKQFPVFKSLHPCALYPTGHLSLSTGPSLCIPLSLLVILISNEWQGGLP